MKFIYPAVFRQKEDGTYEGWFPDLEQCFAWGETLEEAIENANESATEWLTLEIDEMEEGDTLPPVTDPRDIPCRKGEIVRNISVTYRFYDGWEE